MSAETGSSNIVTTPPPGIDHLPFRVYFAILVNIAERFTYYDLTIPFQNFVQTIMSICCAIAADGWFGQYKTLLICSVTYMAGNLILVVVSSPTAIEHGAAPAGFAISLILLAVGSGGFQLTISGFIGDQYIKTEEGLIARKNGTLFIPDKDLTLQFIYNLNYWGLNIGAISGIATTFLELHSGFRAAFLLPLCGLWVAPAPLILGRRVFSICVTPKESALFQKSKVLTRMIKLRIRSRPKGLPQGISKEGNNEDVESVRKVLHICRVLLVFIAAWSCLGQMSNNFIPQAGQMQTNGLPNDLTWFANPILVVLLLPVVQWLLSTVFVRYHIPFGPIARITVGCLFLAVAMAYVTILQKLIYTGPCYQFPAQCSSADGGPNHISVWLQLPAYALIAVSEILVIATGFKYTYETAPASLKSLVQAILLLTGGIAGLMCLAISPAAHNPHPVIMYACLAGSMFLATAIFAVCFRGEDRKAE